MEEPNTLIKAMSNQDLSDLKVKYADNQSVSTLIEGILEGRAKDEALAKVKKQFTDGLAKMVAKLPRPDDVFNILIRWGEVEVEEGEPEEVDITLELPITDDEGKITTPAVMGMEMRTPKVKVFQWIVETNKGLQVERVVNATTTNSKRAITVKRIHDDKANELVGNFSSASKACQHLSLVVGQDSAMRVLTNRNPYQAMPYEGSDIIS